MSSQFLSPAAPDLGINVNLLAKESVPHLLITIHHGVARASCFLESCGLARYLVPLLCVEECWWEDIVFSAVSC